MTQLKVSELLRLACVYAEQDRRSLIDAMGGCSDLESQTFVAEQQDFLNQLTDYRRKRWGLSGSDRLDKSMSDGKNYKTLHEIESGGAK